jgi:pyrroloquinoline quinone biosynthesis protein D
MDNADQIPRPRKGYRLEVMGDDILLYGSTALKTIYLNESAALVWKLCDGARSVRQIAEMLVQTFPEDAAAVEGDVWNTIDRLLREGALRLVPPAGREDDTAAGAG